jgi:hypothetical protein
VEAALREGFGTVSIDTWLQVRRLSRFPVEVFVVVVTSMLACNTGDTADYCTHCVTSCARASADPRTALQHRQNSSASMARNGYRLNSHC